MRFLSPFAVLFFVGIISINNLYALSEASGITWNSVSESYFVVGDEGNIYELDRDLNVLRNIVIGSFDLEAITFVEDRNRLYCLDESNLSLLELNPQTLLVLNIYPLRLENEKKRDYSQFESLVYVDQTFYLSASTKTKKKQFGTLFSATLENGIMERIEDIPLWDISGMTFNDGIFYFLSDHEDVVARYSIRDDSFETLDIPGNHQEGLVFTENSGLLIIDEDGSTRHVLLIDFSTSN